MDDYLSSNTSSLNVTCTVSVDHEALGSPQPYLIFESLSGSQTELPLTSDGVNYYTELNNPTMDNGGVYSCVLDSPQHFLRNEDHIMLKFIGKSLKGSFLYKLCGCLI